jgi:hypothetical protein
MEVELNIASFEVPRDERPIVPTSVYELILLVIGDTHNIIAVASLLIPWKYLIAHNLFLLLISPDMDFAIPAYCYHMCHLLTDFTFLKGTGHASDLLLYVASTVITKQFS